MKCRKHHELLDQSTERNAFDIHWHVLLLWCHRDVKEEKECDAWRIKIREANKQAITPSNGHGDKSIKIHQYGGKIFIWRSSCAFRRLSAIPSFSTAKVIKYDTKTRFFSCLHMRCTGGVLPLSHVAKHFCFEIRSAQHEMKNLCSLAWNFDVCLPSSVLDHQQDPHKIWNCFQCVPPTVLSKFLIWIWL